MSSAINSAFPPSKISVPLPAILVAIVIPPNRPAWAIISASLACCFAFKTLCLIPFLISSTIKQLSRKVPIKQVKSLSAGFGNSLKTVSIVFTKLELVFSLFVYFSKTSLAAK